MSLDALRGFDMFLIIGADTLAGALHRMRETPVTNLLATQLEHVDWEDFRFYDLIFPLFIFMVAVALVYSLTKTIEQVGRAPDDRPKILFPEHTIMPPNTTWFLTKDASAFFWGTAQLPSFEYAVDSLSDVPQLDTFRRVSFSSTGGLVGFYSASNNLMDLIIYGETDEYVSGWEGPAIPSSGQGIILKRNHINGTWCDTDTSLDWFHHRVYQIGQSDFPLRTISCSAVVTLFVSPDTSFKVVADELQKARHSIDMNMYEFTNPFLYQGVNDALKRERYCSCLYGRLPHRWDR